VAQSDELESEQLGLTERCKITSRDQIEELHVGVRMMLAIHPASLTLADSCAPAGRCWIKTSFLYLPLDHVGERRSPKLRYFEVRQVGSRRDSVLVIGAIAVSCREVCGIRCTQRWVRARAPRSGPWIRGPRVPAERAHPGHPFLAAQKGALH
jgi:hypothetical protein